MFQFRVLVKGVRQLNLGIALLIVCNLFSVLDFQVYSIFLLNLLRHQMSIYA